MAVKQTYDAVGNREDLTNILTMISVEDTPLLSMAKKGSADGIKHEYLEDALKAPGANKHIEGETFTPTKATSRTRKFNYCQIFHNGYGVSGTQETVKKAGGIKSEKAYQMVKATKEHALDIEYAIVNNTSKVAGDDTTPRELGGIAALITTNVLANGGTARALTETLFVDGLQKSFDEGGKVDTVVCSSSNKRVISGFTAGSTKNVDAKSKKLVASVDVYEGDFGVQTIVPHRLYPNSEILLAQKDLMEVDYLRKTHDIDLPKTADSENFMVVSELTYINKAEKANTRITDLNTSDPS